MTGQLQQDVINLDTLLNANEQKLTTLLASKQHLSICHHDDIYSYVIINKPEDFSLHIKAMTLHESKQRQSKALVIEPYNIRAIVNIEINVNIEIENWLNNCSGTIFLRKVHLNRYENNQYLYFTNCHFREWVSFGNSQVKQPQRLHLESCTFQNLLNIVSTFEFIDISRTVIKGQGLMLQNITGGQLAIRDSDITINIQNSELKKFIISKCKIENLFVFRTFIDRAFDISHATLKKNGYLKIDELLHSGSGRIDFEDIKGRVQLSEVNLSNTTVNIATMTERNYEPFYVKQGNSVDYSSTLMNFNILHTWAKNCEEKKYSLDIEFIIGKLSRQRAQNENDKKSGVAKWFNKLIRYPLHWVIYEKALGYFCKWQNILFTILSTITIFAVIYLFSFKDTTPVKSLYFSLITFTTVGYGDISPEKDNSLLMLTAGIEGLLGVILISFLTVTIVRRYVK
ncbi:potassium channel family protein [Thalassomonas sp. RHCl1]|uniref:potassium channel family protein n=1 Tax=Thalassomonas sp. RHCl1 TaxID=2995320 RepID=UPI00248D0456|nr:potassium channel family protein [Thalassomonas sp. RHCl1]